MKSDDYQRDTASGWAILGRIVARLLSAPVWMILIIYPPIIMAWGFLGVMVLKNATGEIDTISPVMRLMFSKPEIQLEEAVRRKVIIIQDFLKPIQLITGATRVNLWSVHDGMVINSLNIRSFNASLAAENNAPGIPISSVTNLPFISVPAYEELILGNCIAADITEMPHAQINGVSFTVICPIMDDNFSLEAFVAASWNGNPEFQDGDIAEIQRYLLKFIRCYQKG